MFDLFLVSSLVLRRVEITSVLYLDLWIIQFKNILETVQLNMFIHSCSLSIWHLIFIIVHFY